MADGLVGESAEQELRAVRSSSADWRCEGASDQDQRPGLVERLVEATRRRRSSLLPAWRQQRRIARRGRVRRQLFLPRVGLEPEAAQEPGRVEREAEIAAQLAHVLVLLECLGERELRLGERGERLQDPGAKRGPFRASR